MIADVEVPATGAIEGVIVAQGGRFGGWALYCLEGRPCYVYNWFGLRRHVLRGADPMPAGAHEVRLDFCYDGGGVGRGGIAVLSVDGVKVADGVVDATVAYYFSFDETFDVGVALGTPVSEEYADTDLTGTVHRVRVDLTGDEEDSPGDDDGGLLRRVMTAQ